MSSINKSSRNNLLKQIINYQLKLNNSNLIESTELAKNQLRWLKESAQEKALVSTSYNTTNGTAEDILKSMVNDLVVHNKPLAYIIGNQPFHPLPLPLLTRAPTLIPRPETEHWTNKLSTSLLSTFPPASTSSSPPHSASSSSTSRYKILDIGTGTGCIPLGLYWALKDSTQLKVIGVDRDESALDLARENVQRCFSTLKRKGKEVVGEEDVKIIKGDLFDSNFVNLMRQEIDGEGFNLIVSNPPYITKNDFESLDLNVRNWEDRGALVGEKLKKDRGNSKNQEEDFLLLSNEAELEEEDSDLNDDGLIYYKKITELLKELLTNESNFNSFVLRRPSIVFEVGQGQSKEVESLLINQGFKTNIWKDPWNIERTVIGYKN